jgi:glutamate racemase
MKSIVYCIGLAAHLLNAADPLVPTAEHALQHPKGDSLCSFDHAPFNGDTKAFPIGVFDSGIGGLTVLDALLKIDVYDNSNLQPGSDGVRDFASEHFVYFGDQANMPYGNYPAAGRVDLLRELILRDAVFLLSKRSKAIVIACNTATAYGLADVRSAMKTWRLSVPVIGVVEAGARGVMEALPSEGTGDAIAVFATVGTCSCEAYPKAISQAVGLSGKSLPLIVQQGCVGLAGAIEGDPAFVTSEAPRKTPYLGPKPDPRLLKIYGFDPPAMTSDELNSVANHVRYEVTTLVEKHRNAGHTSPIGMVVLGCTHFPLVQREISETFNRLRSYRDATGTQPYATLIREKLVFINPAEFTAKELYRELARAQLRSKPGESPSIAKDSFYMSIPNLEWPGVDLTPAGALEANYKHRRRLGEFTRNDTPQVPMKPSLLPASSVSAIQRLMPEVWLRMAPR